MARRPTAHTAVLQGQGGRFVSGSVHIARLKPYIDPSTRPYQVVLPPKEAAKEAQSEGWQGIDPIKEPPISGDVGRVDPVEESPVQDAPTGVQDGVEVLPPAFEPERPARREGSRERVPTHRYKPSLYDSRKKRAPEEKEATKASSDEVTAEVPSKAPRNKKLRTNLSLVHQGNNCSPQPGGLTSDE